MQNQPTVLLLLTALSISPACAQTAVADSFSILTYNVHGLPSLVTGDDTPARMRAISPHLAGYDLVALQENFAHSDLLLGDVDTPERRNFEEKPEDRLFGSGLSLLSRHPIVEHRPAMWTACHGVLEAGSDCLAAKGYQMARVQLDPERPEISLDVYNLHMDAGGGEEDQAARASQVEQLLAALAEHSSERAVIVIGDTNLKPKRASDRQALERLLAEAGLEHACAQLAPEQSARIDRILFRSAADLQLTPYSWTVQEQFVDGRGAPLSDHAPIAVGFRWHRP